MRRIFFSLLILLTAFRGVVGDVMAYEMSTGMVQQFAQSSNTTEFIASSADSMPAIGHFSTKNTSSMPCHEASTDSSADTANHACNACMVCHSPMLQRSIITSSPTAPAASYVTPQIGVWLSADLPRLQKPPVS